MTDFPVTKGNMDAPEAGKPRKPQGMPKTVRIVLEDSDEIPPTGQFFGVNGEGYVLVPGREADVPYAIKEILDNAKFDVPQIDPQTQQVIGWKTRLRYPYRIIESA